MRPRCTTPLTTRLRLRNLHPQRGGRRVRRGMALIVVMVVVLLVSLATYGLLYSMREVYEMSKRSQEHEQARLAALSGSEFALGLLELPPLQRQSLGSLENNPGLFHARTLLRNGDRDAEDNDWRFSMIGPAATTGTEADQAWQYGLENETAKIHIPTLLLWDRLQPGSARTTLMNLAGANESSVDAFIADIGRNASTGNDAADDWLAPWYGDDWNHNFRSDPIEQWFSNSAAPSSQGRSSGAASGIRGSASTGRRGSNAMVNRPASWQRYLTWDQGCRNETWDGKPRVYLNATDLSGLYQNLSGIWPREWAAFLIAYRQYGPAPLSASKTSSSPASSSQPAPVPNVSTPKTGTAPAATTPAPPTTGSLSTWVPDLSIPAKITVKNVTDLIGVAVEVPSGDGKRMRLTSPFSDDSSRYRDYLGRLIDEATVVPSPYLTGCIDILAAPREVLLAVPGLDASIADRIVGARGNTPGGSEDRRTPAWLLYEGHVDRPTLQKLLPWITCRSDVYRIQCVGFRDARSPTFRCTMLLDARQRPATIQRFQHWHEWDPGTHLVITDAPQTR